MSEVICIYHKNCLDGFGAAWCVYNAHRESNKQITYAAFSYGEELPIPMISGKEVIIVDFSFPLEVMKDILRNCTSLIWLDHHKTAQEIVPAVQKFVKDEFCGVNVDIVFDMNRSGALIAWDYFDQGYNPAPSVIRAISDRDLWQFKYPDTKAITAALYNAPMNFETWDHNMTVGFDYLLTTGNVLISKQENDVQKLADSLAYLTEFQGFIVPIANAPFMFASDLGNLLAQGYPFAIIYWKTKENKYSVSLRSTDKGEDVAELAKKYGGGGHRNAAGFRCETLVTGQIGEWLPR